MLLTDVGAKSGTVRTSALVYFTDQVRVVLIPSNFGGNQGSIHPGRDVHPEVITE